MTDVAPAVDAKPVPAPKPGWAFTDDGCRTEIRLGVLLVLAGMFLWLWAGPTKSNYINLIGIVLVVVGVPLQVWDARRSARPGYPVKLGLIMTVLGALMWKDLIWRERYDDTWHVQPMAPVFLGVGLWILAWWPFAKPAKTASERA